MTTQEGNKLIQEYEGYVQNEAKDRWHLWVDETTVRTVYGNNFSYHEDWARLMPVVLKILKEEQGVIWLASSSVERGESWRVQMSLLESILPLNSENSNPILAVWQAVVEYLQNKK